MLSRLLPAALLLLSVSSSAFGQNTWTWRWRTEVRADYRWSADQRHPLGFPFPDFFLPPGQERGRLETPDAGSHVELNTAELQLDLGYGEWLGARAKVHGQGLHRRNPTSSDRKFDFDELYVRIGPKPEMLERPAGTSVFVQVGKFPKMERQPTRLLESYGLAATSFNRFEDTQVLLGGTIGRNFYWRAQAANGNPLFFRDPNALAGDNGTPELRERFPTPVHKSGFPILYNAETEDLVLNSDEIQLGEGLGFRWQSEDQTVGFDAILFHYARDLADHAELYGTFYGGDLDLLNGVELPPDVLVPSGLPINGRKKEELGARIYAEWGGLTAIAQYTDQEIAGLERSGWELETGYQIQVNLGWLRWIQPAVRVSGIDNQFRGNPATYPAPSIWWDWVKFDGGIRAGLTPNLDVTAEYSVHEIDSPQPIDLEEVLVTVRWRMGT
jgi:hypothetical protein